MNPEGVGLMKRIPWARWITCVCLLVSCAAGAGEQAGESRVITIGTFNIQGFGETKDETRIGRIAEYCRNIDLLAVQEVHENGIESVAALAKTLGPEYQWAVSDVTTWERFAFIWKPPVMLQNEPVLLDQPRLGRKPFLASFKAGNFDFQILNLHLFFDGSKKTYPHTRMVEFKLLDDWLCHREDVELDLLLAGDFNAPGMAYGYRFPVPLSSEYFFYELLNRHAMISVTVDSETPTSIINQNIYDHIIFNPAHNFTSEFAGPQSIRVIRWETRWDENKNAIIEWSEYETARKEVSDHRIVTAGFQIDLDDDDDPLPEADREDKQESTE